MMNVFKRTEPFPHDAPGLFQGINRIGETRSVNVKFHDDRR